MNISSIFKYFRDCYKADTRTFVLNNFFSNKVTNRLVIEGEDELLSGHLKQIPIAEEYAIKVRKDLSLYQKEKELYLFSFFVTGSEEGIVDKKHKICAPLFVHPCQVVHEKDFFFLNVDFDKTFLNINYISKLLSDQQEEFYRQLSEAMVFGAIDFGSIGHLKRLLSANIVDFDGEELLNYPKLSDERDLRRAINLNILKKQKGLRIFPAMGLGVLRKSEQTRGVLNELTALSKEGAKYSAPIKALFAGEWNVTKSSGFAQNPGTLNEAQREAIDIVNKNIVSQITGPPGTGKSFTIASLAINYLSNGKSVLVSAKTNEAVDVIGNKIADDFGLEGVVVRAGKSDYKMQLKRSIKNQLYMIKKLKPEVLRSNLDSQRSKYRQDLDHIEKTTDQLIDRLAQELDWGKYLAENESNSSLFSKWKKKYIKWRQSWYEAYWTYPRQLFNQTNELKESFREYVQTKHVHDRDISMQKNRSVYSSFCSGLSARYGSKREQIFNEIDFREMLHALPIWLVKASEVNRALPLKDELFDLVIIDEATQCDIASALPLLQRAKRAVVVGDPQQLNHVSFLSRDYQNELIRKYELNVRDFEQALNYRDLSIFNLVNNQLKSGDQVVFLNEHFRSNPDIIAFSNSEFYGGSLTIMTDHPERRGIVSTSFVNTNGSRCKDGINRPEAESVLDTLSKLVREDGNLEQGRSFGVLSPFRDQVDYLNEQIIQLFDSSAIKKHRLLCGTAYSFQGEERDVMLLSMCLDAQSHPTAFYHLNKPDVFNVSITRAKTRQFVFLSVDPKELKDSVFKDFLTYDWHHQSRYKPPLIKERFLTDVTKVISRMHITFKTAFPVAGRSIDLLCEYQEHYFGINLIGYPGKFEEGHTVEELKLLFRSGLEVFPIPFSYWYFDQENCITELQKFVDSLTPDVGFPLSNAIV